MFHRNKSARLINLSNGLGILILLLAFSLNLAASDNPASRLISDYQVLERVNVNSAEVEGDDYAGDVGGISTDGRFVVFESRATNLVETDQTPGVRDVFVRDRFTGETTLAAVNSQGEAANAGSSDGRISADGRYVIFESTADNLVPDDTNNDFCPPNEICGQDIFLHDRETATTTRINVSSTGEQTNDFSSNARMSVDARYIVFSSSATNLVPEDNNDFNDVFRHDRQTGQTVIVSLSSDDSQGNDHSSNAFISTNGRYVVFESYASNLVPGDTNAFRDVFVRDLTTGTTRRLSVNQANEQGNDESLSPQINAGGRYVAFTSYASNLVPVDTNGNGCAPHGSCGLDLFLYDLQTNQISMASVTSDGSPANEGSIDGSLSADGRYMSFTSLASNLIPDDTEGLVDIFVKDFQTGEVTRINVNAEGESADDRADRSIISADGQFVIFESLATNLVSDDTNNQSDIFVAGLINPGPIDMVLNGSFEVGSTINDIFVPALDPWQIKNNVNDKVKCNKAGKPPVAYDGECAFLFKGQTGEKTRISQKPELIGLSFTQTQTFDFRLFVKATNAASVGKIKVIFTYSDSTPKGKIADPIVATTDYTEIFNTYDLVSSNLSGIKIQIKNTSPSGKIYIDDVSLSYAPVEASLISLPEPALIPLP